MDTPLWRAFPRVALRTGQLSATAIHLRPGTAAAAVIDTALDLARRSGRMVSIVAPGPVLTLPNLVTEGLRQTPVAPAHLELSFPLRTLEQAGIEALLTLSSLRDMGVRVALRGFGRGAPVALPRLPISTVIIAPGCLHGVPADRAATQLLQKLLDSARDQGLRTVAVGVETEAQRALLSGFGCDEGEGSLFGPAIVDGGAPPGPSSNP